MILVVTVILAVGCNRDCCNRLRNTIDKLCTSFRWAVDDPWTRPGGGDKIAQWMSCGGGYWNCTVQLYKGSRKISMPIKLLGHFSFFLYTPQSSPILDNCPILELLILDIKLIILYLIIKSAREYYTSRVEKTIYVNSFY